jgi:hypothetical protein
LRLRYPHLRIEPLRGNVNTRLMRLDKGHFDVLIAAVSGLRRVDQADRIIEVLSLETMCRPIGAGIIALQCRADDIQGLELGTRLNDLDTNRQADAERAMLRLPPLVRCRRPAGPGVLRRFRPAPPRSPRVDQSARRELFRRAILQRSTGSPKMHRRSECSVGVFRVLSGDGPIHGALSGMESTRVGYARCSTGEQDVEVQIEQLTTLGVDTDRIYIDRGFSGTRRDNRAGTSTTPRSNTRNLGLDRVVSGCAKAWSGEGEVRWSAGGSGGVGGVGVAVPGCVG